MIDGIKSPNCTLGVMPKTLSTQEQAQRHAQGRRIWRALQHADLTQSEVAKRIRVSVALLSRSINGERELRGKIAALAKVCRVPVEWLRDGIGEEPALGQPTVRRGPHPSAADFVLQLHPNDIPAVSARARAAFSLPVPLGDRIISQAVRASGFRASIRDGERVFLVIAPTSKPMAVRSPSQSTQRAVRRSGR